MSHGPIVEVEMMKLRLTLFAAGALAACGAFAGPVGIGSAILNQSLVANAVTNYFGSGGGVVTTACDIDSYQIVKGTLWSGLIDYTWTSDNQPFVLQSLSSGITRFLDVNMTCENIPIGGTLTKIEVMVEASASLPTSFSIAAWSWTTSKWIALGSLSLQSGDTVAYFSRTTNISRFVSTGLNKKFKLRFYRTSSPVTTVRIRFDDVEPRFTWLDND